MARQADDQTRYGRVRFRCVLVRIGRLPGRGAEREASVVWVPEAQDVSIPVVGMLVVFLSGYHSSAALAELTPFFRIPSL